MADNNVQVDVTYEDKRTITLKKLDDAASTREFTRLLREGATDGYVITMVTELQGGMQYDPYTIGIKIVMSRAEPPKRPQAVRPLTSRDFQ